MSRAAISTSEGLIQVQPNGEINSASNIQRIFQLPMIPGFPDYRACPESGRVISTQMGKPKEMIYDFISAIQKHAYRLYTGGQECYLTKDTIIQMIERNGNPKRKSYDTEDGVASGNDQRFVIIHDGRILGEASSMSKAESECSAAGHYIIAEVKAVYRTTLQAQPLSWRNHALPFYGIDGGLKS